ncbi:MAG: acylphosphatase [Lentisphaerae bacterium]|nr:acylphosphatase [Lentisphaerota bacterium]
MNNVRREVYFSGQVQGVGFRYTVMRLAANLDVTGFVRNMLDGRVQLIAEGSSGEIDRLLDGIRDAMGGYIRDGETIKASATGEFRGFGVR